MRAFLTVQLVALGGQSAFERSKGFLMVVRGPGGYSLVFGRSILCALRLEFLFLWVAEFSGVFSYELRDTLELMVNGSYELMLEFL